MTVNSVDVPQMSRLEHYMAFMKLPPELQLRINNYYQARYGGKWFHEKDVMDTVSSALKEVQLECKATVLGRKYGRRPSSCVKLYLGLKTLFPSFYIRNKPFVFVLQQIMTAMCSRLLRKVPMFQERDENFIHAVLLKLRYEVFLEGDAIVQRNVPGDRMFFIDHGQVVMETESEETELCDGDFFGGELTD